MTDRTPTACAAADVLRQMVIIRHPDTNGLVHWTAIRDAYEGEHGCVRLDVRWPDGREQVVVLPGYHKVWVRADSVPVHPEVAAARRVLDGMEALADRLNSLHYPLEGPNIAAQIRQAVTTAKEATR